MKWRFSRALRWVAENPFLNLFSGLILVVAGLLECIATLVDGWYELPIGSHHGLVLFGLLQMVKALPDTMKGLGFIEVSEAKLTAPRDARIPAVPPVHPEIG